MLAIFRPLRHGDFRTLWARPPAFGQSLLVLRLSDGSTLALGAVSLAQGLAFFIFVLAGGMLADRFEPRRILLVTQSASLGLAVVLSLLTFLGLIQVWSVMLLAFLRLRPAARAGVAWQDRARLNASPLGSSLTGCTLFRRASSATPMVAS